MRERGDWKLESKLTTLFLGGGGGGSGSDRCCLEFLPSLIDKSFTKAIGVGTYECTW